MTAAWIPDPEDVDLGDEATADEQIEYLLGRLARRKAELAKIKEQRDRWVEKYDDWFSRRSEPIQNRIKELEGLISAHAVNRGVPTLHLPSGTVRVRAPRQSLNTTDKEAFRLWVTGQDEVERLSRWFCEPNKAEVKKFIEETGEVVPGVELVEGEVSVTITLEASDE